MIIAINYANEKYKSAQKFNSKMAKKFGADKVIEYSPADISEDFKERNKDIFQYQRGDGCWIWKPYILNDALSKVKEGDYVVYSDSGSAFVKDIRFLIDAMNLENANIMVFCIDQIERRWDKRDALILMDCDKEEFLNTNQICGSYIILKKCSEIAGFINEYLYYIQDRRIVTDEPNVLGKDNYSDFVENRHDQTVLSLLCKKRGVKPFRDPSDFGLNFEAYPEEVIRRSQYPQIIESHRNPDIHSVFQLKYKWWYKFLLTDNYKKWIWKAIVYIPWNIKKTLTKNTQIRNGE